MAPVPQNDFRCVCRHVRMSGSATPATQNDIITCFDTLKQDRFCSFPHRHGHGKRKQEHRDGTCWSLKTSISWETSSNACSHFSASKSTFCYGFLMNLKIATSKSIFRARRPSIFSTSHKMTRLPRNLHVVTT